MRPTQAGLSDEKIDMLQNFLDTVPNAMHFEHLDGFFCALISGPEQISSSEYLPYIFGGALPKFQSKEQGDTIMDALAEHWKHIDASLAKGTIYYPFLYADKDGKCSANDWADAFMLGVQLREASWGDLLEDSSEDALLLQIAALRNELSDKMQEKPTLIDSDGRENLVKKLVLSLQLIYQHYAASRAKSKVAPQH